MDDSRVHRARRRAEQAALARRRVRRQRRLLALLVLAASAGVVLLASGGLDGGGGGSAPHVATPAVPEARLGSRLPAAIAGESAVSSRGGPLVLGGLDSSGSSVNGVFQIDAGGGGVTPIASLSAPVHDAAAVALPGRVLVFGGGTAASTDAVEALPAPGGSIAAGATGSVVGHLPTPRSDLSAVSVGRHAYLLGGYDGKALTASVLRTEDGISFSRIATLPVPARYVAAAVLGGRIFAFGGQTAGGATDAIREIDPEHGSARIVGRMPEAVSHAAAISLGGSIYVLGGETAAGTPIDRMWSFDPASRRVTDAGRLPVATAGGAAATAGRVAFLLGGTGRGGAALPTVIVLHLRRLPGLRRSSSRSDSHGPSPASRPPFRGRLMIADRGNDRLIVVNARKRVLWRYPSPARPAPPGGFYFPDDAFFTHGGTQLIANEEQAERIVRIAFPSGKLLWSYGHAGVAGSEPGYLHEPDDAYLWRDGTVSVADAQNCRVLLISAGRKVLKQFGDPSSCEHGPPRHLGSPNGDTPLPNGHLLVSEVNGSYIDELTRAGRLVWSVRLPIEYPSDPQQLGPDRYLVADYARPGGLYKFNRAGRILWSYHPPSGPGMLDHPSLAERLPGGMIAVNDDYRHRLVIIDPRSRRIVWQYGHTDVAGRAPGYLNTPDGFDLLSPDGTTPVHAFTG